MPNDSDPLRQKLQEKIDALDGKTPWEFACEWYTPEEIAKSIQNHNSGYPEALGMENSKVPENIYSDQFAEWLADQYRLAMRKGIEIGQRSVSAPQADQPTVEANSFDVRPSFKVTAAFLREMMNRERHTEAVADCRHCNLKYAAMILENLASGSMTQAAAVYSAAYSQASPPAPDGELPMVDGRLPYIAEIAGQFFIRSKVYAEDWAYLCLSSSGKWQSPYGAERGWPTRSAASEFINKHAAQPVSPAAAADIKEPCGKSGCEKPAKHRVNGSLTYYACDDHLKEIERLCESEDRVVPAAPAEQGDELAAEILKYIEQFKQAGKCGSVMYSTVDFIPWLARLREQLNAIKAEIDGHAPLYHGLKAGEKPKPMNLQEQVRWLAACADRLPIANDKLIAAESRIAELTRQLAEKGEH